MSIVGSVGFVNLYHWASHDVKASELMWGPKNFMVGDGDLCQISGCKQRQWGPWGQ